MSDVRRHFEVILVKWAEAGKGMLNIQGHQNKPEGRAPGFSVGLGSGPEMETGTDTRKTLATRWTVLKGPQTAQAVFVIL